MSNIASETRWVWFVTGPTASGKTTLAKFMASELGMTYIEANIDKIARGIPLNDSNRWDWLHKLRQDAAYLAGEKGQSCVVTCSALNHTYRDILHDAPSYAANVQVRFLYLDAPEDVLRGRAEHRHEYFAKANIVNTQFQALQPPIPEETDVVDIDVTPTQEVIEKKVLEEVRKKMQEHSAE